MTSLPDILHNIADHTLTLWQLLNEQSITPDFVERLSRHILLEEQENTARLETIQQEDNSILVQKLLDHSYFIQQLVQQPAISAELRRELLDHFMEEHQEWAAQFSPQSAFPQSATPQNAQETREWTVGPLWPQGGK